MIHRGVISLGVGGTAFLVASVIGFEVFSADFPSVFYVLPIALAALFVAAIGTYLALGSQPKRPVGTVLVGVAAISYGFFFLWLVRYAVPPTRGFLPFDLITILSVILGVILAIFVWMTDPRLVER